MQIRNLGRSGLQVSLVGLGCNNFGGRLDLAATRKVVHRALDLGITVFDTADIYGERGRSEEYLGESLGDRRKDIVLATKFGMAMDDAGTPQGSFPALHPVRGRGEPATAQNRLDRSLSAASARSVDPDRGDAARARRSRPPRQGALRRVLQPAGLASRRGPVDRPARRARSIRVLPGRIQLGGARAGARAHPDDGALRARAVAVFPARQRAFDRQIQ